MLELAYVILFVVACGVLGVIVYQAYKLLREAREQSAELEPSKYHCPTCGHSIPKEVWTAYEYERHIPVVPDIDDLRGDPYRIFEAMIEQEGSRRYHVHANGDECWRMVCPDRETKDA